MGALRGSYLLHLPPRLGTLNCTRTPLTYMDPFTCVSARPPQLRWPPHLGGPRTTSPARGRPHWHEPPLTGTRPTHRHVPPHLHSPGCPSLRGPGSPHLRGPALVRRSWRFFTCGGHPNCTGTLTCVSRAWNSGLERPNGEGCAGPSKWRHGEPRLRADDLGTSRPRAPRPRR